MGNFGQFQKVAHDDLFVSEPPPQWFGNAANEKSNKAWTNANWLKSRFHFSFAEYRNPARASYGCLRVMNDDLVQPNRGFGTHPHRDMEIATYIVEGSLTHQDSMSTRETLGRGAIQYMSAGTGVRHSEQNLETDKPLRFIQMWFTPRRTGQPPAYGSHTISEEDRTDRWAHLVTDVQRKEGTAGVRLNADMDMYVTECSPACPMHHTVAAGRLCYLLCMEGSAKVSAPHGEETLARHEAAHISGPFDLTLTASTPKAHCLLIDMAST